MIAKAAAACLRGNDHVMMQLPCQDCAAAEVRPPLAVAVLCDGAGSCAHSELAAERLTQWLPGWLQAEFETLYALPDPQAAETLHAAGCAELKTLGMPPRECYCTLLFYAQHADGRWLCGHIGDGFIFRVADGASTVLSMPENGRYANETYFFSGPQAVEHLRIQRGQTDGETAVLLTSDGCGGALYNAEEQKIANAVRVLCSWPAVPDATEEEVTEAYRKALEERFAAVSDDDLSLAVLWCSLDVPAPEQENTPPEEAPEREPEPKEETAE